MICVSVWQIFTIIALRVCCRPRLLVLMATTVSLQDFFGGFTNIVFHAASGSLSSDNSQAQSKYPGPEGPALVHPRGVIHVMACKIVFSVQVSGVSNQIRSAMSASLLKWFRLDRCRPSSSRRHVSETASVFPHLCYLLEWISGFCMKLKPETRNLKPKNSVDPRQSQLSLTWP